MHECGARTIGTSIQCSTLHNGLEPPCFCVVVCAPVDMRATLPQLRSLGKAEQGSHYQRWSIWHHFLSRHLLPLKLAVSLFSMSPNLLTIKVYIHQSLFILASCEM